MVKLLYRLLGALLVVVLAASCTYTFDNPAEIGDLNRLKITVDGISPRADRVRVELYIEPNDLEGWSADRVVFDEEKETSGSSSVQFLFDSLPEGIASVVVSSYKGVSLLQMGMKEDVIISKGKLSVVNVSMGADEGGDIDLLEFEAFFPDGDEEPEAEEEFALEEEEPEPEFEEVDSFETNREFIDVPFFATVPNIDGILSPEEWTDEFIEIHNDDARWRIHFQYNGEDLYVLVNILEQKRTTASDSVSFIIDPKGDESHDDNYMLTFVMEGGGISFCTSLVDGLRSCSELPRQPNWFAKYKPTVLGYVLEVRFGLGSLGVQPGSNAMIGMSVKFVDSGTENLWPESTRIGKADTYGLLLSSNSWMEPGAEEESEPEEYTDGDAELEWEESDSVVSELDEDVADLDENVDVDDTSDRPDVSELDERMEDTDTSGETNESAYEYDEDGLDTETSDGATNSESDSEDEQMICVPEQIVCELRGTTWVEKTCLADGSGYSERFCDDGNLCTTDTCLDGFGCSSEPNENDCDDGNLCTENDHCSGGICVGETKTCDDGNPCTSDSCDPLSGTCVNDPLPNTVSCDDGNFCTIGDHCDGNGHCVAGSVDNFCCPGHEEMTKFGEMCVDKYEVSMMEKDDCSGAQYGVEGDDYPEGFPDDVGNGTAQTEPVYACSIEGHIPSTYVTLYQARQACQNVGKRLCKMEEWTAACGDGEGYTYPYGNEYEPLACNGADYGQYEGSYSIRKVAEALDCHGDGNVYDMSGNVWEWVNESSACGGYYSSSEGELTCSSCVIKPPTSSSPTRGFRCCIDAPSR